MKGEGLVSEGRGVCSRNLQPRSGEKRAGEGSVSPAHRGFRPIALPSSHRVI